MVGDGDKISDGIHKVPDFMSIAAEKNTMRPYNNTLRGTTFIYLIFMYYIHDKRRKT